MPSGSRELEANYRVFGWYVTKDADTQQCRPGVAARPDDTCAADQDRIKTYDVRVLVDPESTSKEDVSKSRKLSTKSSNVRDRSSRPAPRHPGESRR